ncbi:MAG: DNA-primase RepB domain-containing protein [Rhodospirillales bacterium]
MELDDKELDVENIPSPAPKDNPDTATSLDFLKRFRPGGPWVLTAILPDTVTAQKNGNGENPSTITRTFTETEEAREWINEHQGKRNLYFAVNPLKAAVRKKAEKVDVASAEWLYIDIDPRPGEDFQLERERAPKVVAAKIKQAPTIVIDSGGGYQFFWRLSGPITLGSDEDIAQAEAYNRQLIHLTQADKNCYNVDRIMRLPGTINIPGKTKLKKGRQAALARLESFDETAVYPLGGFVPAANVQNLGERGGPVRLKIAAGNLPKIGLDELQEKYKLPDKLRMIIVQGDDPDEPLKHGSRSEWLFYACCEMARHEVPPETMMAVIMDPDFGISSSVIDKPRAERYALRQVERAMEKAESPELHDLNEKYSVIGSIGGKCRVISEIKDRTLGDRIKIERYTFEDFRNRHMHKSVLTGTTEKGAPITRPMGKWWLEHPKRRQYERLVFEPGRDDVGNDYNLWRGFACEAVPGDCSMFLDHLREVICDGVEEHYQYLIRWLARCVQKPDTPGEVAVVMRGKQGTGKSFFVKQFGSLWGQHFLQVADAKHLVGNFNAHLRDCVVLFGDEAFYAGDRRHESILKMLITESRPSSRARAWTLKRPRTTHTC